MPAVTAGSSAAAATAIFKTSFLDRAENNSHEALVAEVAAAIGFPLRPRESFRKFFRRMYAEMLSHYRCEYVIKNELANRVFLARHNPALSSLLAETRIGVNRVDFVIVNGVATAYEIKSEFDSLKRTGAQVASYLRVFPRVNVVAAKGHIESLLSGLDPRVGVLEFTEAGAISCARRAIDNLENVEPDAIFDVLRMPEYKAAIRNEFGYVPDVPNTRIHAVCRELFNSIAPARAHGYLLEALKRRAIGPRDGILLAGLPYCLKQLLFEVPKGLRERWLGKHLLERPVLA